MKFSELKDLANEQLDAVLLDSRAELFQLENDLATNHKLEKPHLMREKKKDIARILTIKREKAK